MVIVQNFHEQKDTPCYKYLQSYKPFCFLNIFHILSSTWRWSDIPFWGEGEKKVYLSSARCAHCMLRYLYARPGWLEVQLSGILINWTAICFCTTRHLYTGAIRRKQETAKHSALQHATLTANQHYSTATQLRLVHKNTQEKRLELCLVNNPFKKSSLFTWKVFIQIWVQITI